jgi:hypothetical protein
MILVAHSTGTVRLLALPDEPLAQLDPPILCPQTVAVSCESRELQLVLAGKVSVG